MSRRPDNDDDEYVIGELGCSFDELLEALAANGADVERGLITVEGRFLPQAND